MLLAKLPGPHLLLMKEEGCPKPMLQENMGGPKAKGSVIHGISFAGNALARVQRVHKPADLWDITFCTC